MFLAVSLVSVVQQFRLMGAVTCAVLSSYWKITFQDLSVMDVHVQLPPIYESQPCNCKTSFLAEYLVINFAFALPNLYQNPHISIGIAAWYEFQHWILANY